MIEELVTRAFASRNAAHLAHWKTKSYAEHVALGDFYEAVPDLVDAIVEAYQGNFGLLGEVSLDAGDDVSNVLVKLRKDAAWIDANRTKIAQGVRALENLIDSLTELHLKTVYKLTNLK